MAAQYVEVTVRVHKNNYTEVTDIIRKPFRGDSFDADALNGLLGEIEDLILEDL